MTFSERVSKMIEIIKDSRLALIAKGETVPYDDDIPDVIEQMSGGQDTQQLINMIERPPNTEIVIPEGTTRISDDAFYFFSSLKKIILPAGVTSIGGYAFASCSSLAELTLPSSLTSIGRFAFFGCSSLVELTLPSSLTSIGVSAFGNCSSLAELTLTSSLTSIGEAVFYDCSSLALVDLTNFTDPSAIPSLAGRSAFQNISPNCVFLVANAEMQAAFSSATNWSNFTFTIQGA